MKNILFILIGLLFVSCKVEDLEKVNPIETPKGYVKTDEVHILAKEVGFYYILNGEYNFEYAVNKEFVLLILKVDQLNNFTLYKNDFIDNSLAVSFYLKGNVRIEYGFEWINNTWGISYIRNGK